jgi:hypothetical protein
MGSMSWSRRSIGFSLGICMASRVAKQMTIMLREPPNDGRIGSSEFRLFDSNHYVHVRENTSIHSEGVTWQISLQSVAWGTRCSRVI